MPTLGRGGLLANDKINKRGCIFRIQAFISQLADMNKFCQSKDNHCFDGIVLLELRGKHSLPLLAACNM